MGEGLDADYATNESHTREARVNARLVLVLLAVGCAHAIAQSPQATIDEIAAVLDEFHDAAASGDKSRYLNLLTEDAVFMGTDETERWPKHPDFAAYVDARFQDGRGWTYAPVERHVRIADRPEVAWFDEIVYSETNGRFRGTGVLVRVRGEWKIAHYALSFLIDNQDWEEVIDITRRTSAQKNGDD
jgi:ketosteroid isomerase-like protein